MRGIERYYLHKSRTPAWAITKEINAIYRRSKKLGVRYHVDHIVPLIHPRVCGLHCEHNLAAENLAKGYHTWPDMWNEQQQLFDISFLLKCHNYQRSLF